MGKFGWTPYNSVTVIPDSQYNNVRIAILLSLCLPLETKDFQYERLCCESGVRTFYSFDPNHYVFDVERKIFRWGFVT